MAIKHKVIVRDCTENNWHINLANELDELAKDGWRPILYAESGTNTIKATIILSKIEDKDD